MQYRYHIETYNHHTGQWEKEEDVQGVQDGLARLDHFDRHNTCAALLRTREDKEQAIAFNLEARVWSKHYDSAAI